MPTRKTIMLLTAALVATVAFAQAPPIVATKPLAFAVATIKPGQSGRWRLQPTPDGYTATGVSLRKLVQEAYGVYNDKLLTGGPAWIDSDKFDLEAKFDTTEIPDWKRLTYRQRGEMLQPLLAERFKLKVHFEAKPFPVYNLVIAKSGSKLQPTRPELREKTGIGIPCFVLKNRAGYTQRQDCTVASLDDLLRYETGRSMVDKTGLTGHYDFELRWTPDNVSSTAADDASGPSIFTALQEQLGLKLEPSTALLNVLVIDHAEQPSEN
jgi:uncharacterized protein (TIGR03435 family)